MIETYRARKITFVVGCAVLSGCYTYIPTQLEAVPPGQEVQLLVTREGARELANVTDMVPGPAPTLRGAVAGTENGDLLITVPVGTRQEGFHQNQLLQTVRVPTGEILSVGIRELNVGATALAIGATATGVGLITFVILESFGGGNSQPGEEIDFTIFSLPTP